MKILSAAEIEESPIVQSGYDNKWGYLLMTYGKQAEAGRVVVPEDLIDMYMVVVKDGSKTYLGQLKEYGMLSETDVALICCGGWQGFEGGGSAFIDGGGSIFVKVNAA